MRWYTVLLLLPALAGCIEDPRPKADPEDGDGAVADGGAPDRGPRDGGRPLDRDATPRDATPRDAAVPPEDVAVGPDGRPPVEADAAPDVDGALPDGALLDGAVPEDAAPDGDVAADASAGDADFFDGAPADAALDADLPQTFLVGAATAADGTTVVTVRAGGLEARAEDGHFVLGPLPGGPVTVRFEAPLHQAEAVEVDLPGAGEVALEEPVLLYRGRRVTRANADRLLFRFDERWLLWQEGDRLLATPTGDLAPRVLVAADYEVFLGYRPGHDEVVVRRRTQPGIAGDVDLVPLDGGPAVPLFVEAQPWVQWVGDAALGMVRTREALSHLEVARPGMGRLARADRVPWLLVKQLADGSIAWASGAGPGFDVFRGGLDGGPAERLNPRDGQTSDAFLTGTPGNRGLLWLDPGATLWRWEPEAEAEPVADDVLASPRPRFLNDGRLLFWRAEGPGTARLFIHDGLGERLLVGGAAPNSHRQVGDRHYVARPGRGLWFGDFEGGGEDVIEGDRVDFVTVGAGAVALVDGVGWRHGPGGADRLGGADLERLAFAPRGATAWRVAGGEVWYLPAPGEPGAAAALVRRAPSLERLSAVGDDAIYVLGAEGAYERHPLPPGEQSPTVFDRALGSIVAVDRGRVLGRDGDNALWQVEPRTGESFGWARAVETVELSGGRGYVAYTCDRGLFLVPLR